MLKVKYFKLLLYTKGCPVVFESADHRLFVPPRAKFCWLTSGKSQFMKLCKNSAKEDFQTMT